MEGTNELSDGQLKCRHYREHAVGRNSADVPVLRPALQRCELLSHIPMRQVRGIWHTSHAPRIHRILNTHLYKYMYASLVCVQQREESEKTEGLIGSISVLPE